MPEPKLSRMSRERLAKRGSASGPTPTEPAAPFEGHFGNEPELPLSDTTAGATIGITPVNTSAPTPSVPATPTSGFGLTSPPACPRVGDYRLEDFPPVAHFLPVDDLVIVERLADGANTDRETLIRKILAHLTAGRGNWSNKTTTEAVRFYLGNFYLP